MDEPLDCDLSVVVPAYNCPELLEACLSALARSEGLSWETLVIDNASPVPLDAVRDAHPEVRWIRLERNAGYAGANNLGLREARGRYACWLNQDAEVEPDTLATLVAYLDAHRAVGAATPVNVSPEGVPQPSCSPEHGLLQAWLRDSGFHLLFPNSRPFRDWKMPGFDAGRDQEIACTQTTCLVMRREAFERVGPMNERLFLFYNDVDYCRRLVRAGWKLAFVSRVRVLHHGSAIVETAPWKERQLWKDRYRYYREWFGLAGTLGVRCACLHRGVTRVLAQLLKGRFASIGPIAKLSLDLYLGLDRPQDAV